MYCPNCDAAVVANAKVCSVCNADFGELSAWRPLPQRPNRRAFQPIFSGVPKVAHAWQAVLVFLVFGPPVGLLALAYGGEPREPLWIVLHPFALIGAFAVGGPAALLAGLMYCGLSLAVVFILPRARVRAWSGALLGAVAALLGATVCYRLWLSSAPDYLNKISQLAWLSLPAGVVAGLLSGWLLPVGRQKAGNQERDEA